MHTGTISLLTDRQSGFIARLGITDALFFHADHLREVEFKALRKGDKLSFKVQETTKGPYAIDVHKVVVKK